MADVKTISKAKGNNSGSGSNYSGGSGGTMSASTGAFKYLTATKATIEDLNASSANINDLKSNSISSTNISSAMYTGDTVSVSNVDTNNLQAENGYVTELEAPMFKSDHSEIKYAGIEELKAQKADIDTAKIRELLSTNITTDYLTVLKSAHFFELIIDQIKSAGGSLLLTPADGFELYAYYTWDSLNYTYLYWVCEDDAKGRYNMWQEGDQAICQNFNNAQVGTSYNVSNKFWWAYVLATSGNTPRWVRRDKQGVGSTVGDSIYDTTHPSWRRTDFIKADGYVYKNSNDKVIDSSAYEALTAEEKANYSLYDKAYFRVGEFGKLYYVTYEQYLGTADYYDEELGLTCRIRLYSQADCKRCHWIRISHTNCDSGSVFDFSIGDNVVMLGSQTNTSRQSAIYIAAYDGTYDNGEGGRALDPELRAPLIAQYRGINDFNLSSHRTSYFDARSAEFYGSFKIQSDSPTTDGTNVLDFVGESTLSAHADNVNINIPCNSLGEPISYTSYYDTTVKLMYGSSEQEITSYSINDLSYYITAFSISDSAISVRAQTAYVGEMDMVTPVEVTLTGAKGTDKTTVTFNKIIPGQNGEWPELYELTLSDTIVKRETSGTTYISVGLNKFSNGNWAKLSTLGSNDLRIVYSRNNSTDWYLFALDSTPLPDKLSVTSTTNSITIKLVKRKGASWDSSHGYAADITLDTQTVVVVQDGQDGKDGQDGQGTSGEFERILWMNKELIVNALGTVTVNLLGQLQYVIGSTVQTTHDWTKYKIELSVPEIHATFTSNILFDNSKTTSTGKFHTGNTGDWNSSLPVTILTDFFTNNAGSFPDRAILRVLNGTTVAIEEAIPLIFKAGAMFDLVDDRIEYAVLDENGSLANVLVKSNEIDQLVANSESFSQIKQRADEIDLSIRNDLANTGINIESGQITINADNTSFNGNIKMFNSDDGLTIYSDNGEAAVNIKNQSIGSFGASQNVITNFNAKSSLATYGVHVTPNVYMDYRSNYDSTAGYNTATSLSSTSIPARYTLGKLTTGNTLTFENLHYSITGDANDAWNGKIGDYKVKFQLYWLNTDNIVYDSGWISPTRTGSSGNTTNFTLSLPNNTSMTDGMKMINNSFTVGTVGSGYDWTVLIHFKGPNTAINGTRNKKVTFEGGFTFTNTVSQNTKIGVDGMYSMSENGQFWAGNNNIGMYFKNTGNNIYGSGNNYFGWGTNAYGLNKAIGKSYTALTNWDRVETLVRVNASTSSDSDANRLNGTVGWSSWSYNPICPKFELLGYEITTHAVHPSILLIEGQHPSYKGYNHFIFLNPFTGDRPPIGLVVTIINHSGTDKMYAVGYSTSNPSGLPQCMYDDDTTNRYRGIPIYNGRTVSFIYLGGGDNVQGGYWKPLQMYGGGSLTGTNF